MTESFAAWRADLPVAGVLARIVSASRRGAVVVTAPPGSGKTMLVPAAVLDDLRPPARVVLLQPRRLAARAVARQIARIRGCDVGSEVGYQVRFDSRIGRDTRLVVETTGIMLRRLLDDITLDGIDAVVLDEFHERTIEMDLVLGLLVRLRRTVRPDLRIVVMSATLDAGPVQRLLGDECELVSAAGRMFPVDVRFLRHGDRREMVELVASTVPEALRRTHGHVLVFLPGVGEILRCERELAAAVERQGHAVMTLFGDLPPEHQDRVLEDVGRRKVILSTNVAETSLTIPGVTAVVDSGLARRQRVSHDAGLPRLELVPISRAAAEQRAGRAGRTEAGICWRLWDESAHARRADAEVPEAIRGDLAGPLLQLVALGEARNFPWLDEPPAAAIDGAIRLLRHLGALEPDAAGADHITPLGRELAGLPAHPRLGRLLLAGAARGVLRETSIAAALLSERDPFRPARHAGGPRDRVIVRTRSDVVDRVAALQAFHAGTDPGDADLEVHAAGGHAVLRVAEQLYRIVEPRSPRAGDPATALMHAVFEAYPDRLARLRAGSQDRATMVGGRGVRLDRGSRVRGEQLFVAIDLDDAGTEAGVRQASAVEREWLSVEPLAEANLRVGEELVFQPSRRQVEARRRTVWMDLILDEFPAAITDDVAAAALLAREAAGHSGRVLPAADSAAGRFLARVRWLQAVMPELGLPSFDDAALVAMLPDVCCGLRSLDDIATADWLSRLHAVVGPQRIGDVERLAPQQIELQTGRRHALTYDPVAGPVLAVRIQELFGVPETPRIANGRVPVLLHLLGPNHRPQQVTSDLAGFWQTTYPAVKRELQRRYPKHAWPDDPRAPLARRGGA